MHLAPDHPVVVEYRLFVNRYFAVRDAGADATNLILSGTDIEAVERFVRIVEWRQQAALQRRGRFNAAARGVIGDQLLSSG